MTALNYLIVMVGDMSRSVAFYRDTLGLKMRFESAYWTEFETGTTVLALHPGSAQFPAGAAQAGLMVADLDEFHKKAEAEGVRCVMPPAKQDFGGRLAIYLDPDGLALPVSETKQAG